MDKVYKVVFDTQVFLRTLINPKSACGRLVLDWSSMYILYVADAIIVEILDVLNRPKIRARFPQISNELVDFVAKILKQEAITIEIPPEQIEPICRDPKDDIFLACAKIADADYLISEDNDLLVIAQHGRTKIVNVVGFLTVLEASDDDASS